ncbi:MAG: AAA family ATPase [Bacteroidales bacterium]|nr:AAA family ATPase [Bacteroidales bacterium]MCF8377093.1 AAA family ATPase [Bacteroidales bacterium]
MSIKQNFTKEDFEKLKTYGKVSFKEIEEKEDSDFLNKTKKVFQQLSKKLKEIGIQISNETNLVIPQNGRVGWQNSGTFYNFIWVPFNLGNIESNIIIYIAIDHTGAEVNIGKWDSKLKNKKIERNKVEKILNQFHNRYNSIEHTSEDILNNKVNFVEDAKKLIPIYEEIINHEKGINKQNKEINNQTSDKTNINQILYGPPGTGKTYNSIEEAVKIASPKKFKDEISKIVDHEKKREAIKDEFDDLKKKARVVFITFHQSYGYEEFIEGIKPVYKSEDLKYEIKDGVFKKLCLKALGINEDDNQEKRQKKLDSIFKKSRTERKKHFESEEKYVIIVDEINRGNISKIFGELITLIEKDKRLGEDEELTTTLPYSTEEFGVPPNVYIIGTMNSADRSIALMDTALRRRFRFIEKMPETDYTKFEISDPTITKDGVEIDVSQLLKRMNDRIEFLYDRDHTIGHSYFLNLLKKDRKDQYAELCNIFQNEIIPLLQEYFYDDWEKIQIVLGDAEEQFGLTDFKSKKDKLDKYRFVRTIYPEEKKTLEEEILGFNYERIDNDKKLFEPNLLNIHPLAFRKIYEDENVYKEIKSKINNNTNDEQKHK